MYGSNANTIALIFPYGGIFDKRSRPEYISYEPYYPMIHLTVRVHQ